MNGNRSILVSAPAKINLGLEILGRRGDGYHEIRTILAAIDLTDVLRITIMTDQAETRITGVPGVIHADNLIQKAIDAYAEETGLRYAYNIDVQKHIPSPGGLGGASSNAASTLMALDAIHQTHLPRERIEALSATLGSDVPFFTGSPMALATGTGVELEPLPSLKGWLVLVVPRVTLSAKTPTLYAALRREDFTSGERVAEAARAVRNRNFPSPHLLANAFTRPVHEMQPELATLANLLTESGAPNVNLSGAGPGHYVLMETEQHARSLADKLAPILPEGALLRVVPTFSGPPSMEFLEP